MMDAGRKHLLTIGAVALLIAIAVNIARGLRETPGDVLYSIGTSEAVLVVDPSSLDFGDVAATDKFTWEVPVRNVSDRPVRIDRFITSCGCVAIEPERAEIAAGESETFRFTLNLLQGWKDQATFPFSERVHPVIPGVTGVGEVWNLRGTVHNVFRFDPPHVDFGKAVAVGTAPQPQVVTATPYKPVEDIRCRVVPNHANVDVSRTSDGRFRIRISPRETEMVGDHAFRLLLTAKSPEADDAAISNRRPAGEVSVAAVYQVVEPVEPLPGFDHLGMLNVGQSRQERCGLRSRLGGPVQVERFELLSPDVEILSHDPLGFPTELFIFEVVCTPKVPGEQRAVIRFDVTHPEKTTSPPTSNYKYDYELRYHARRPDGVGKAP